MDQSDFRAAIEESIATKTRLLRSCLGQIEQVATAVVACLRRGGKVMWCGNGGSACDAAHAAAELVGWFEQKNRPGYASIALGHEVPMVTAVGNDAGFERIFARQVEALGRAEDMLVGISTSGRSRNVVLALEAARARGMSTAALVGEQGGPVADLAEVAVRVPSTQTPRIQESHLLCVHLVCAAVEQSL
jgi:D-sedoheptulose 7-phosphate isomerase